MNEIIIGDRVITEATEQAAVLLDRYRAQINQTYLDDEGTAFFIDVSPSEITKGGK